MDAPLNALNLLPRDLLAQTQGMAFSYSSPPASATLVAASDPTRVVLVFVAPNMSTIQISPDPGLGPSKPGIVLGAGGTPLNVLLSYWLHGPLVAQAWYALGSATQVLGVWSIALLDVGPIEPVGPTFTRRWRDAIPSAPRPVSGALAALWRKLTGR